MARLKSELLLTLKDHVTGPARGVEGSMARLRRNARMAEMGFNRSHSAVDRLGGGLAYLGRGAVAAAAPLAAGLGAHAATREAIDFESALSGIQQKAGATDAEMQNVRRQIAGLADDKTLGASLDDIIGGFERAAAAGVPINELGQFVRVVAKAAPALDMTGEALGNTLSQLEGASLITRDGSQRFLDLVNALEDAGTSNASDILDFMLRAGAGAKIMGFAAEETAALGGAMVDLGINSAEAGTAVNAITTKLTSPKGLSKKGQAALKGLYGSTEAWTELVQEDTDAAFVDLLERMRDLDDEARGQVALDIFGLEHADIVQRLIEGLDKIKDRLRLAKDESQWLGNLDRTAALKMKTTEAQLGVIQRRLQMLAINAGDIALPGINAALEAANGLFDTWDRMGNPFEHLQAGAEGFAQGLGFENLNSMLDDISTKFSAILGIGGGQQNNLTQTMQGWRTLGEDLRGIFEMIEKEVSHVELGLLRVLEVGYRANFLKGLFKTDDEQKAYLDYLDQRQAALVDRIGEIRRSQEGRRVVDEAEAKSLPPSRAEAERASMDTARQFGMLPKAPEASTATVAPTASPARFRPTLPDRRFSATESVGIAPRPADRPGPAPVVPPATTSAPAAPVAPVEVPVTPKIDRAALEAQIREIDQRLGDLSSAAREIKSYGAASGAATSMGQIADEMQRLMQRRDELDAKLQAPLASMAVPPVDTGEMDMAQAKATQTGGAIAAALSVTARPSVDTSSIDALIAKIAKASSGLRSLDAQSRALSRRMASARADYSGLHADLSYTGE
ncbi:MAG: phage tail tape measure protein [Fulvimarina manganoxydans]|uniref:phage tail tape measure protein n=1 Tax=Fulvimarina manganoxydans TaxID=937218 RepID=UPI0023568FA1|nr:phage tail tape measure protein [Fulvimarina manganoxydans]MCK5932073.1 phage tail tape measure protein [Fulvimarina manganoxydans]